MIYKLYDRLCQRYGTEYIAEAMLNVRELIADMFGAIMLFAGIIGMWFIGCAIA